MHLIGDKLLICEFARSKTGSVEGEDKSSVANESREGK